MSIQEITENTPLNELTYEQAYSQLEMIVQTLESDEHPLDKAMELFERGQALARHCVNLLDRAELKVQQILEDDLVDFPMRD